MVSYLKENSITLIGMTDIPSVVDAEHKGPSGTVGLEFSAIGAYRFFNISQQEIKNQIHALDTVIGTTARKLEERIANTANVNQKIKLIEQFLIQQLDGQAVDRTLEYCVNKIANSKGRISIKALEKETGYSARYLNLKFARKIGISPKNLASIVRFQQFYQAWTRTKDLHFFEKNFYEFYYDQSHFIKDFKRFTGLAPTKFAINENEFGRIF